MVHILIQGRSVPVAACPTGGKAFALAIAGPRAYVACHDRGIRIIDISDPAGLNEDSLLGTWSNGYAAGIGVAETTAFVASARRGLIVLDLQPTWDDSSLTQPEEIGSYYTGGTARRAKVRSDLLFVADGGEGLKILDISNPRSPLDVGSLPTDDARDVALLPEYTLVADAEIGLIVCDIADPRDPRWIATLGNEGIQRVVLQETLVVTAGSSGIEVFDFSDPRNPRSISRYQSSYVEGLCFEDSYLYLAEGYRGLTVLDLQSPEHPIVVSTCPEIYAVDVAVQGGYALVVDSEQIQVVEVLIPEWLRQSPSPR